MIGRGSSAYIRASMLGGLADMCGKDEAAATDILTRNGIPAQALTNPDMLICWRAVGDLMEDVAAAFEKPCLGLEWVESVADPFLNFGPLGLLARFHPTLEDWCTAARDYCRFHTNAYGVQLVEPDSGDDLLLRIVVDELVPPSRHQIEYTIGSACQMIRSLTAFEGNGYTLVRFQHLEPEDTTVHERVFGCPIEFGASQNELVFRRGLHDLKISPPPEHLKRFVAARCRSLPDFDGSSRAIVEAIVPAFVGTRYCTLANVAELLSMNPKKLQRALAGQDTNFAHIIDRARERMARQMLISTNTSIASISGLLGYSTMPSFGAAFRRWTGLSAREFRKAHFIEGDAV